MDTHFLSCNSNNFFSVELFPVKQHAQHEDFINKVKAYEALGITSINITCKAQSEQHTIEMVRLVRTHTLLTIIPHILAYKLTPRRLDELLLTYSDFGIRNLFVIRGDLEEAHSEDTQFVYAEDLVKEIKRRDPNISLGVAAYPEGHFQSHNFLEEMNYLKRKVDAGADYIITQLFFNNKDFYELKECCKVFGITVPIIPGLAYVKNSAHLDVLVSMAQGSRIPAQLLKRLGLDNKDFDNEEVGTEWLRMQIVELVRDNPIIHLYAFNRLGPLPEIIKQFNVK